MLHETWVTSLREPVVISVVIVLAALLANIYLGMPASPTAEFMDSFGFIKRNLTLLSLAALIVFVIRYIQNRDLFNTSIWLFRTIFLYIFLVIFGNAFSTLKSFHNTISGFFAEDFFAGMDRALHFGVDAWRVYTPFLEVISLKYITYLYTWTWFTALLLLTAIVAGLEKNERLRIALLRIYFTSWIGLGLVVATIGSSAGPVYYGRVTGDIARFAPWRQFVDSYGYHKMSAGLASENLWQWYMTELGGIGGGIAAFPSLHVAMAAMLAFYAFTFNRILGAIGLVWLIIIQAGSVLLGWHYAVDGYFSILAITAMWWLFVPKDLRKGRFALLKTQAKNI